MSDGPVEPPAIPPGLENTPIGRLTEAGQLPPAPGTPPAPRFWGRLKRLVMPTQHVPEEYDDDLMAGGVNWALDRRFGASPAAHESQVGQSVALCFEEVLGSKAGPGVPLYYLVQSIWSYRQRLKADPEPAGSGKA